MRKTISGRVSPGQTGFLPRRSILSNVLDLEEAALTADSKDHDPAILLLDSEAAFPSIAHQYLKAALVKVGIPKQALSFVNLLYHGNHELMKLGRHWQSLRDHGGVRQGCPYSSLLFVTAMDGLLRRMRRKCRRP